MAKANLEISVLHVPVSTSMISELRKYGMLNSVNNLVTDALSKAIVSKKSKTWEPSQEEMEYHQNQARQMQDED